MLQDQIAYVYIISNRFNTVIYTGVTNDLERRLNEHKSHTIDGFSKKYNLDKLVYFEEFQSMREAIEREKEIKGWKRAKKNALIETINPAWADLAKS